MDRYAVAPRSAAAPVPSRASGAPHGSGRRAPATAADLMPSLLDYWRALPRYDETNRKVWLADTRAAVRAGKASPRALVVPALGDVAEDIVFTAVADYVGLHPVSVERRQASLDEATGWIRRGLALNRGAVFAALLSLGESWIDAALTGLRLSLDHAELEVVCRRAAACTAPATREFLADWQALLEAADRPDPVACALVGAALAGAGA